MKKNLNKSIESLNSIEVDDEVLVKVSNIGIIYDSKFDRGAIRSRLPLKNLIITVEAENNDEMFDKFNLLSESQIPDLVIVGSDIDFINSYKTVEWLKKKYFTLKIIFISHTNEKEKLIKILKLGVNSILYRDDYDPDDIESEINKILYGERKYVFDDSVIGIMLESLVIRKQIVGESIFKETINERDKEIIKLIIQEKKGVEIAEKLSISARTVENIINNLFVKFEVKSRVGLVVKAQQAGLLD